jgi:hypothetical protein
VDRIDWPALEALVHCDPAARGLASFRLAAAPLDAGQLRAAAVHLARHASGVAIVTGFCALAHDRVTTETDGPPGALYFARALIALGVDALLITDRYALPLLEVGCYLWRLDRKILVEFPFEEARRPTRLVLAMTQRATTRPIAGSISSLPLARGID